MSSRDSFRDFVLEQLAGLPGVVARPMFGGHGLYAGGRFFGILYRGALYLKVDDGTRSDFESAGMGPFRPFADRPTTMQYFEVPAGVLDDPEELTLWAAKAVAAAATKRRHPDPKVRRAGPRRKGAGPKRDRARREGPARP